MALKQSSNTIKKQGKTNRKGIHAKTKSSVNKLSKHYKKLSVGQG